MAYTAIDDAGIFFNTKLYTGTGASNAQTGVGFQPDFTWIKNRDATDFHVLTDAVRGATKYIMSDAADAETTNAESLKTFDSDGFTVGTMNEVNTSTEAFVAWNWKAGTTSGIDTTGVDITPSAYSFNTTSGISIIKYTGSGVDGAKIAHGLGAVPHMMIIKRLESSNYWAVYHHKSNATPEDHYLVLDTNAAVGNAPIWKDTVPTSVYYTVDTSTSVNATDTIVGYFFTSIQGFSKFGSYTGNGNADGPFVYTGFRPAFVMIKKTNSTGNWCTYDNKRLGYNSNNNELYPDLTNAEGGVTYVNILSNGFKLISSTSATNNSGDTYVYMAFAHSPFVNSEGVPTNAR